MTVPTIDGARLTARLAELRVITSGEASGVTRLGWTAEERQAVDLVTGWAEATGARVWVDQAGSLIAELPGTHTDAEPLVAHPPGNPLQRTQCWVFVGFSSEISRPSSRLRYGR